MRPKFLITLAVVVGLILAAAFLVRQKHSEAKAPLSFGVAPTPSLVQESVSRPTVMLVAAPVTAPSLEEKRMAVDQQIQQLQTWAQADDSAALESIMNELTTSSESKVRFAAIAAAKQSGHREIIPALQAAAGQAEDPKEKRALSDAAEFLAQPTVSEQTTNPQPMSVSSL